MEEKRRSTRRNVLKAAGTSVATLGTGGLAAAKPDETVEVNVGFGSERGLSAARNAATETVREFDSIDVTTIRAPKRAAEALAENPNVRYVEENGTMEALAETTPWGVDRVDADVAHGNNYAGTGADVAVVDTGIDSDHPDLQGNLGVGVSYVGDSWDDDNGHGTHVAGTIAAVDDHQGVVGVAPGATLHAVKALSSNGSGSYSDIAAGIEWAADRGHDVVNLSIGGGKSSAIESAVEYAYGRGVMLVGAVGGQACSGCVAYPAAEPEVIAVSATDENDDLASFSSYGSQVELAAPGTNTRSTYNDGGYRTLSGTSMATAHVAGAAAQVMAAGYSNASGRQRLRDTAEHIGLSGDEQGHGLVDVAASLGLDSGDD